MKKKLLIALIIIALMLPLAACGGSNTVSPTAGVWEDDIFTSEYLGLRFALPFGWSIPNEAEITLLIGMAEDMLDIDAGEVSTTRDMTAINFATGANVQISFMPYGRRAPSHDELFEVLEAEMASVGGTLTMLPGTTTIAGLQWYSSQVEFHMSGEMLSGHQFFNVEAGYIRSIMIAYTPALESAEEILAFFFGLNDPPPAMPALAGDSSLLGAWDWDIDARMTHNFFEDGSGFRTMPGETEYFQWYTLGSDLFIVTDEETEHWAFTIESGVLTLDSRQIVDFSWSHVESDNTPAIPPSADALDPNLLGYWDWDMDSGYTYNFAADGTGTRGFPGAIERFVWQTEGDFLIIDTLIFEEHWSFTIANGVLTIDSRQVPGMTFSYIAR